MGMKREAVQEERQRTKDRDTAEVESTSNPQSDMPLERIMEAEKMVECNEPYIPLTDPEVISNFLVILFLFGSF